MPALLTLQKNMQRKYDDLSKMWVQKSILWHQKFKDACSYIPKQKFDSIRISVQRDSTKIFLKNQP